VALKIAKEELIVAQRIFFQVHPLIIEKVCDALGNLHDGSPLVMGCGIVLTPIGQVGYC